MQNLRKLKLISNDLRILFEAINRTKLPETVGTSHSDYLHEKVAINDNFLIKEEEEYKLQIH